jgi:hypothetical protein
MQNFIFAPLGMSTSTVHACSGDNAAPHGRDMGGAPVPIDPVLERFADAVAPAGSVWSTVLEMAEYVKCELSGGLDAAGQRIVSAENLLIRREPGVRIGEKSHYGLGLIVLQHLGLNEVTHGGNTLGFTADMLFLPEHSVGYVVLTNVRVANSFLGAFHQRFVEVVFGAAPAADAMIAAEVESRTKHNDTLRETIRLDTEGTAWIGEYLGRYECEELGRAEITRESHGYRIAFESWASDVGSAADTGDKRELVLTSAPWRGGLRLQVHAEPKHLVLDGGQTKYVFRGIDAGS